MTTTYRTLRIVVLIAAQFMTVGLGLAQQAADIPPESATVEGMVINALNSRSVPRAEVVLQGMKGQQASKSTRADINGRFIFKNVDPGTYRLSASRQGFFSDSHKPGFQPVFEVTPGAHIKDMPLRLMLTAVVTGSIVDEYNDPVQNVEVKIFSVRFRLGQISLTPAGNGLTDDRGEYRISGLHPGKYYVVAKYKDPKLEVNMVFATLTEALEASRNGDSKIQTEDGRSIVATKVLEESQDDDKALKITLTNNPLSAPAFTYPPLFFPNTSDFRQAQQLHIGPGDEVHADFVFFTMPSVSIKGRVVNGLTGQPATGAEVSAYWTEYLEGAGVPAQVSPKDGTFEISGMSPGSYTLRATFADGKENFTGQHTVEVGDKGIENVQLAGQPEFSASGHVTVEGAKRAAVDHVAVAFIAEGVVPRVQANAKSTDLKFDAQLHPQTRYHVSVSGLPEDYYLKSVALSGHDMPKDDFVVSGRRGEIELVISPEGGHIEGTVFDQKEQPTRGSVLLVPDVSQPGPPELFRRTIADTKGKFSLRGVAPGSYKLLAFAHEDLEDVVNEPDFLKSFANVGQKIIVEESGFYRVEVKMIETPETDR